MPGLGDLRSAMGPQGWAGFQDVMGPQGIAAFRPQGHMFGSDPAGFMRGTMDSPFYGRALGGLHQAMGDQNFRDWRQQMGHPYMQQFRQEHGYHPPPHPFRGVRNLLGPEGWRSFVQQAQPGAIEQLRQQFSDPGFNFTNWMTENGAAPLSGLHQALGQNFGAWANQMGGIDPRYIANIANMRNVARSWMPGFGV